jgi:hypothetical protein
MSNTAHNTNGKGRVVTNAPKSAKGKSATTSKKVGIPTRKPASVRDAIVKANATNARKRVKPFATEDGFIDLLDRITKLSPMPHALTTDGTKEGAEARREWCVKNGIPTVRAYDDGLMERRAGCPQDINGWRPDNAVRIRLDSVRGAFASVVFHYTRHDTNYYQCTHAQSLDWSNGQPDSYEGADMVYIYTVGKPKPTK